MTVKPDIIQYSSLLPSFINIGTATGSITLSGSVANASTVNFSTTISLLSANNFFNVYATNPNNSTKTQIISNNNITFIYQFVSTETVQTSVVVNGSSVVVTITVNNNSGSTITLTSATYSIEVVEYQSPL